MQAIATVDAGRREIYTRLIRVTASSAVRRALEELMATVFKDEFVDGLLDRGRAEGEARGRAEGEARGRAEGEALGRAEGEASMLLRILLARGFDVPDDLRQRVQSCTDIAQLEAWGDRAVTATSLDDIFAA